MDDVQKAALASIFRALLAMAGGAIVKHGWANDQQWTTIAGALTVLVPVVWGVVQKYVAERNAQARASEAYAAGSTSMLKSTAPPSTNTQGAQA